MIRQIYADTGVRIDKDVRDGIWFNARDRIVPGHGWELSPPVGSCQQQGREFQVENSDTTEIFVS